MRPKSLNECLMHSMMTSLVSSIPALGSSLTESFRTHIIAQSMQMVAGNAASEYGEYEV
jgi:hypothetical protein